VDLIAKFAPGIFSDVLRHIDRILTLVVIGIVIFWSSLAIDKDLDLNVVEPHLVADISTGVCKKTWKMKGWVC
jgi:hypothetical protein